MTLKRAPVQLHVDERSPIPIRRQLTEQLKHFIEGGGFSRDRALPSIRALAGFLMINPNTVARVFEDLRQSGYVESRRGKGVFVSLTGPARLAQLPAGTRVGVVSDDQETAHNLKHSIANAGLPNLTLVGACRTEKEALGRVARRSDVVVCSTPAAERVRLHAGPTLQLIIDDRTIDKQAIDILAAFLVRSKDQETHRFGPGPGTAMRRLAPVSPRAARRIG